MANQEATIKIIKVYKRKCELANQNLEKDNPEYWYNLRYMVKHIELVCDIYKTDKMKDRNWHNDMNKLI